jgi:hypothetical protein
VFRGTPTGAEIERSIPILVERIKPLLDVPSYGCIVVGLRQLTGELIFHYKDFHLTPHESKRINAAVNSLLVAGKITKDPSREKVWLGSVIVRKLAASIVQDAVNNGTLNWDVTWYKALSIVYIACLACRTGDVTKGQLDDQLLPYLCYDDITLKLVGGDDIVSIQLNIVLRNEKTYK